MNRIEFVQRRPSAIFSVAYAKRRYKGKSPIVKRVFLAFQDLWFWIADRLDLTKQESVGFDRIVVKMDDLAKYIRMQKDDIAYTYHRFGSVVLVGPEEFVEVQTKLNGEINLMMPYGVTDSRSTVFGMHIVVVPWMKGALVVPREILSPYEGSKPTVLSRKSDGISQFSCQEFDGS